jgi:hypothetical protein
MWQRLLPAEDGSHHVFDGRPAYAARFDEVMKFHAPGLAPVRRAGSAWHIDVIGAPAYARRFRRTFGFYDGLAAVENDDGWHHVKPDGSEPYAQRHAWCGNYQEQLCTVRDGEGRYFHVDLAGRPCTDRRWRYAGDFRDGVAVVQRDDGLSSHVAHDGHLVHDRWFEDLDVFHKGFARARDDGGWMHVDRDGRAVYSRRFALVEPFYNGQARVERFDGALEVIGTDGSTLLELRPARRSEFAALSSDLVGYWRTETIAAAVELGVFEALPAGADDVALRCRLSVTRAPRLLRALEELGLVAHQAGAWHVTARGEYLGQSHPLTLADASTEYARRLAQPWTKLPDALREGTKWTAPDIFADVASVPSHVEGHHRMLRSYARHDYVEVPEALGLRGDEMVIDAGGGLGALAVGILGHYPKARVVLLDRPEVVGSAEVPPGMGSRMRVQAADIFAPWPVRGDAVVLARVLHDCDDERAIQLLRHARAALVPGGRLCVVEMILAETGGAGGLCDLHLLTVTGGRERTRSQYAQLLGAAGLALRGVVRIAALPSILVAEVP